MKTKLFFLIFLSCFCISFLSLGQDNFNAVLKIKELYRESALKDGDKSVNFDSEKMQITLSEYVINLSPQDTHYKYVKSRENGEIFHQVQFFCQNGTTVIDKTDLNKKRAWLALNFKSKEACYEMITLLDKLVVR